MNCDLAPIGAEGAVLAGASVGDRVLFGEVFRGCEPPFVRDELFVRQAEIFLARC